MKQSKLYLLISLMAVFFSCENTNENGLNNLEANDVLLNELGEQEYRNDGMQAGHFKAPGKFQNPQSLAILYRSHSWAIASEDGETKADKQGAMVRLSYLTEEGGLEFTDPQLGDLLLEKGKKGFGRHGHMGPKGGKFGNGPRNGNGPKPPMAGDKGKFKDFIYSWAERGAEEIPASLAVGATPEFSTTLGDQAISSTLNALPDLSIEMTNISEGTTLDVNSGITVDFASELPAGSVVGVQFLPFKFKKGNREEMDKDARKELKKKARGLMKQLHVKIELTEAASSVSISAEALQAAVEAIKTALGDDLSDVSADVFATTSQENGSINFDLNGEEAILDVIVRASKSVKVAVTF